MNWTYRVIQLLPTLFLLSCDMGEQQIDDRICMEENTLQINLTSIAIENNDSDQDTLILSYEIRHCNLIGIDDIEVLYPYNHGFLVVDANGDFVKIGSKPVPPLYLFDTGDSTISEEYFLEGSLPEFNHCDYNLSRQSTNNTDTLLFKLNEFGNNFFFRLFEKDSLMDFDPSIINNCFGTSYQTRFPNTKKSLEFNIKRMGPHRMKLEFLFISRALKQITKDITIETWIIDREFNVSDTIRVGPIQLKNLPIDY